MKKIIKIGNAQGFWGDQNNAAAELLKQQPDIDYLTLDYLSEVSLSIMAVQKSKDETVGFAKDFLDVIDSLTPHWKGGSKVKVVTNAGGLNPIQCALAIVDRLRAKGCHGMKVAACFGDDVLNAIRSNPKHPLFNNLETGSAVSEVLKNLSTANVYLGAENIANALKQGVDIVVTGRTADPSLTVAPCMAEFGWKREDYGRLAQATIAGHLIECGTQVTGGIATHWMEIEGCENLGFPFVEMASDGHFIITKPLASGGEVSLRTVKEQLLYEIGDPAAYLSPDVTVSFLGLNLKEVGVNRVSVEGAIGSAPPSSYKVSATYQDGFKAEATLAIFGKEADAKGRRTSDVILARMKHLGCSPQRSCIEILGAGGIVGGVLKMTDVYECLLRIAVADSRKEVLECFSKQIAPMVTSGAPGTTGYVTARAKSRPVFGFWPCLIERSAITPSFQIFKVDDETSR